MSRPAINGAVAMLVFVLTCAEARGQISRVSEASGGGAATGMSMAASISRGGRSVAFASDARNLVADDPNVGMDIFLRDRVTQATTRISVAGGGGQEAGINSEPSIGADGRFVVFTSTAPLVAADTNVCSFDSCRDVYVRDVETGTTSLVSMSTAGAVGNDHSFGARVSADGRFVAFASAARNLEGNVAPNPNESLESDVFLRDRQAGTTRRLSASGQGFAATVRSRSVHISEDGGVIAFSTEYSATAMSLLGPEEQAACVQFPCVLTYAYTTAEARRTLVTLGDLPRVGPVAELTDAIQDMSADGRFLLLHRTLRFTVELGFALQILLHDRVSGRTTIVASAPSVLFGSAISGDGRHVAYIRPPADPIGATQLTIYDRLTGLEHTASSPLSGLFTQLDDLSADGRVAAFTTAVVLTPDDTNGREDVFVFDQDADRDGMTDGWETAHGLDPAASADATADPDNDGHTNVEEYVAGSHPKAAFARYFAEGATNAFFRTRIALLNPGDSTASVQVRFLGNGGGVTGVLRTIAPRTRLTIDLHPGANLPASDFSTIIEATGLIVADRHMAWDATGFGAHAESSIAAPAFTWFFAEGATHGAFDLFYLLQNPNAAAANVTISYLRPAPLTPIVKTYAVPANTRRTIWVDAEDAALAAVDVAARIDADRAIVAERAMYFSTPAQAFAAGHAGAGVPEPATVWLLAEGATGAFFDLYLLVGNPSSDAALLSVAYLLPNGDRVSKTHNVAARSRLTITVADEHPRLAGTPLSTIVHATNGVPVVVERAMWWPKGAWYEAHLAAGATTTARRWAFADGEVDTFTETFVLIANTSPAAGAATVTLLVEGGSPIVQTLHLPANSRTTIPLSPLIAPASSARFGVVVDSSTLDLVVERATYATANGVTWAAGTAALTVPLPPPPD